MIIIFKTISTQFENVCKRKHNFLYNAYETVEWKFLENVILKVGFAADWVKLIMVCVTTVHYTVLHDDREFGPIFP